MDNKSIRRIAILTATVLLSACSASTDQTAPAPTPTPAPAPAPAPTPTPADDTVSTDPLRMTMGGSSASSGVFAFLLAHARLVEEADSIQINVRESGTADNPLLVSQGSADLAIAGKDTLRQAYTGTSKFEGNALNNLRLLQNYLTVAEMIVVRSDQGIESLSDLNGKSFAPSFQGSPVYDKVLEMFSVLGVEVKVFDGALEDVVDAMKDGRIVGFGKAGNGLQADASMLDVASAVPVTLLGFSEEDVRRLQESSASINFVEVPAGALLNSPAVVQTSIDAVYFTSTRMSDEDAYRLARALWQTREQAAAETSYSAAMGITESMVAEAALDVPLHNGAKRFFDELKAS